VRQKAVERKTHKARYEQYTDERRRLKAAADGKARRSAAITGPPKRMGNSEARLHRMGGQRQKKALDKAAKAAKSRLKQLERVEKPYEKTPIVFDLRQVRKHNPVLARVNGASKAYGSRQVLRECRMTVPNEKRTALVGPNGCGKTTLMNMIASGAPGIETCAGLRIGYFTQDIQNVDGRMTVLENAMADTRYDHQFVRTILNRMLFGRAEVDKRAAVLSGGERIRLSLAKIILSPAHLLMLDEPTNYLDIPAREALEDVLRAYGGAVLITSHDRAFVRAVAHRIVALHDGQAKCYEGGWEEYTAAQDAQQH